MRTTIFTEFQRAKTFIEHSIDHVLKFDLSLSSGFFGILEIYDLIYKDDKKIGEWLNRFETEYKDLDSLKTGGWEKDQKIRGLYYGLAGIGYSLIRFQHNKNLPSVLYF